MTGQKQEYVLGIDLGGTSIKGAVLDLNGRILEKMQVPTLAEKGPEKVAHRIIGLVEELLNKSAINKSSLVGMGIGVPGQSDCIRGCVYSSPNLAWENVFIVDLLKKDIELPVFIENDASAAALGELWSGAGKEVQNFVAITIGTGIGGGVIIGGRLYRGSSGMAGEIGHTVIDINGPKCSCGNNGCLEAFSAAPAILKRAKDYMKEGKTTELSVIDNLTVKDVFELARKGDEAALAVVDKTAYFLGFGLGNMVNIFNPELIVVGGGVSAAGDVLFEPLRKYTLANTLKAPGEIVKVVPAELGNDAGCIGAAGVALQELEISLVSNSLTCT